ncbi:hypothetical protein ACFVXQ_32490, partial [Kitasatospora sp. NPDC058263]
AAVHGRLAVGGRADFAVFAPAGAAGASGAGASDGARGPAPRPAGCLATVLAGRLVYRRR